MKIVAVAALTCAAILVAGTAVAEPRVSPPNQDPELRQANAREVSAFMATDPVALAQLWSDDFLVTNPLNQVATKSQVLAMVKDGMLSFKSYGRTIEYIEHYGDIAIVIGSEAVEWSGKMPLAGKVLPLRYTAIWQHGKGGWQEVARHANIVPPRP